MIFFSLISLFHQVHFKFILTDNKRYRCNYFVKNCYTASNTTVIPPFMEKTFLLYCLYIVESISRLKYCSIDLCLYFLIISTHCSALWKVPWQALMFIFPLHYPSSTPQNPKRFWPKWYYVHKVTLKGKRLIYKLKRCTHIEIMLWLSNTCF